MDLVSLNSTFHEDRLVEKYSSLIWTERYSAAGDFQLVSNSIQDTISALPLDSYVSLRNSTVPMKVEAHKIEKKKDGIPQITVVGRSFEATSLELRAAVRNPMGTSISEWVINAAKESDAAYEAMRVVLGDTTRYMGSPPQEVLPVLTPAVSPLDAIPEIDLVLPADYRLVEWDPTVTYHPGDVVMLDAADNIYRAVDPQPIGHGNNINQDPMHDIYGFWTLVSGTADDVVPVTAQKGYAIPQDNLYKAVLTMIGANHHGIKATRPTADSDKVAIEIYNGADLTDTVVYDARLDQINSGTYLFSRTGETNVAYVYASGNSTRVPKTTAAEPSGLNRKVLLVNATEELASAESRTSRGLFELYKNNATALFGGEVASIVANAYNRPGGYSLGDIIKLNGEYGLYQNVRVSEFIRSVDAQGEKAYPTFEAIEADA